MQFLIDDLYRQVDSVTRELREANIKLATLKKNFLIEETRVIGLKLDKEKLNGEIKKILATAPRLSENQYAKNEIDERFRQKLSTLLEKVK